eukprot:Nitzschia sp. Nitz4//scaffold83_size84149//1530//1856//NITZ4_005158-RA/size84149-processed-gene-0.11-mRNA-1//1//CDS//3329558899//6650//frame0
MSTIESILTRELNLRFIDARIIASEAKVALGIQGYPSAAQLPALHQEAERIFYTKSAQERSSMQQMNVDFESMKHSAHSVHSDDESSVASSHASHRTRGFTSLFRSHA